MRNLAIVIFITFAVSTLAIAAAIALAVFMGPLGIPG